MVIRRHIVGMMRANFCRQVQRRTSKGCRQRYDGRESGHQNWRHSRYLGIFGPSTLVFGWKSRAALKADATQLGSKVSRPSCPRPRHCHPERSRGTLCWKSNREVPASGWTPRAKADLSTSLKLAMGSSANLMIPNRAQRILCRFQQGLGADRFAGGMDHP